MGNEHIYEFAIGVKGDDWFLLVYLNGAVNKIIGPFVSEGDADDCYEELVADMKEKGATDLIVN